MMNKDYTIKEFGELIGVSRVTIWNMINAAQLHAYKVRNAVRIPASEYDRITQENRISPKETLLQELA